jgi:hypothetical protein
LIVEIAAIHSPLCAALSSRVLAASLSGLE